MEMWCKVHKKIWNNPYMQKPAYVSVWLYLLTHASVYGNEQFIFNGKQTKLKPGQLVTGAYKLSKITGVPRGTVERILETFKNEEQIEIQKTNKYSIITVVKWKQYQGDEEQNEEQVRNKRGTSEDNKEDKKNKNTIVASPKALLPEFNSTDTVKHLVYSKRREIHIIGIYWNYLKMSFPNKDQYQAQFKRHIKAAKDLVGYSDQQILETMKYCDKLTDDGKKWNWTLETVLKKIDIYNLSK